MAATVEKAHGDEPGGSAEDDSGAAHAHRQLRTVHHEAAIEFLVAEDVAEGVDRADGAVPLPPAVDHACGSVQASEGPVGSEERCHCIEECEDRADHGQQNQSLPPRIHAHAIISKDNTPAQETVE